MYKEKLGINNLENILEEIVFKELYLIVQKGESQFCKCNVCIQDIAAIVLNTIPPMYENSEKHLPNDDKLSQQSDLLETINVKLKSAIKKVTEAPHHHSMQIN